MLFKGEERGFDKLSPNGLPCADHTSRPPRRPKLDRHGLGEIDPAGLREHIVAFAGVAAVLERPSDMVGAAAGPIAMTNCIEGSVHDCALEGSCRVKPHLNAANDAVRGALAAVSLAQLACPPVRPELVKGLSSASGGAPEERGFDKLSPNGVGTEAHSR